MIEWKEYYGYNKFAPNEFPDDYNPTVLEVGRTYLVCTEKGAVLVKTWYGVSNGGFRTYGPSDMEKKQDTNVLYYAELNLPEDIEAIQKYDSVQKLALEVIRLRKIIRNNGGNI